MAGTVVRWRQKRKKEASTTVRTGFSHKEQELA